MSAIVAPVGQRRGSWEILAYAGSGIAHELCFNEVYLQVIARECCLHPQGLRETLRSMPCELLHAYEEGACSIHRADSASELMNHKDHDMRQNEAELAFTVSTRTSVPIPQIWETLGDFGTEHRWTKTLLHCERDTSQVNVGTARNCTLARPLMGRTQVREELVEFVPGKVLAYRLDGPAGPFRTAASRWTTSADAEGKTVITVEGRFTPKNRVVRMLLWPLVRPYVARVTRNVLGELESFLLSQQRTANA